MKPLLYIIAFLVAGTVTAQKVNWVTFDEALAAQKKDPKPIFMDVYTTWCGPCKLLEKNTLNNADVSAYINENFHAVKFNAEGTEEINYLENVYTNPNYDPNKKGRNGQHEFARAMKIRGFPSLVFFDRQGGYIQPVPGYMNVKQIEIYLKMIATDDYKEMTTAEKWQKYQDEFKYTFKG